MISPATLSFLGYLILFNSLSFFEYLFRPASLRVFGYLLPNSF